MRLLLDTHVIIWSAGNPEKLSPRVRKLLIDTKNFWVVSMVTVWELQIKSQLVKLNLSLSLPNFIETQQRVNNLQILPIELTHIYALEALPSHHRDPFDRILIAQAIVEKMPLLSIDAVFDVYPVQIIWE